MLQDVVASFSQLPSRKTTVDRGSASAEKQDSRLICLPNATLQATAWLSTSEERRQGISRRRKQRRDWCIEKQKLREISVSNLRDAPNGQHPGVINWADFLFLFFDTGTGSSIRDLPTQEQHGLRGQ